MSHKLLKLEPDVSFRGDLLSLSHPPLGTGQAEGSTYGSMAVTWRLIC